MRARVWQCVRACVCVCVCVCVRVDLLQCQLTFAGTVLGLLVGLAARGGDSRRDLDSNGLTGTVPSSFGRLSALVELCVCVLCLMPLSLEPLVKAHVVGATFRALATALLLVGTVAVAALTCATLTTFVWTVDGGGS